MNLRPWAALLTLYSLAALVAGTGCGNQSMTSLTSLKGKIGPNTGGGSDSIPPPPPPPNPGYILPVEFQGSDSTVAGGTGELRWAIGNESDAVFTADYTLTCALNWPGFPKTGSIAVPALHTAPLAIPVAVPANAATGMVEFRMEVTRPNGIPPTTADGWLRVYSNAPPPPPPPPPVTPVVYLGADSVQAGGTLTQSWRLTNESAQPFTMQWTLSSHPNWAGLPQSGSVSLLGGEARDITTTASVPDTAAAGVRWLRMTVSRPNGLPDASTDGHFLILP
jgi:hypothetical protein